MTKAQYAEYLASTAWLERRRLVMQRCRGYCEGCGSAPATQVHHLTYAHVGAELLFELVAVCDPCHDRIHARASCPDCLRKRLQQLQAEAEKPREELR